MRADPPSQLVLCVLIIVLVGLFAGCVPLIRLPLGVGYRLLTLFFCVSRWPIYRCDLRPLPSDPLPRLPADLFLRQIRPEGGLPRCDDRS